MRILTTVFAVFALFGFSIAANAADKASDMKPAAKAEKMMDAESSKKASKIEPSAGDEVEVGIQHIQLHARPQNTKALQQIQQEIEDALNVQ